MNAKLFLSSIFYMVMPSTVIYQDVCVIQLQLFVDFAYRLEDDFCLIYRL